jgi:hypothetical protein
LGDRGDGLSLKRLRDIAEQAVDPCVTSSIVVSAFWEERMGGAIDPQAGYEAVREQVAEAREGGLSAAEATLAGQATALNVIFAEMARRGCAALNRPGNAAERYMRVAMKAQAQCRATLHELRELVERPSRTVEDDAPQTLTVIRRIVEAPRRDEAGNIIPWPEEEGGEDWLARNNKLPAYGDG